jgi:hypothetical protein
MTESVTRFYGVFAPNSKYRVLVTPAKRGKGTTAKALDEQTPVEKRVSMTWAKRLKRVFDQACQRKLFHMENPN